MPSPDEPTPDEPATERTTRPAPAAPSAFPFDLSALGGGAGGAGGAGFGGSPLGDLESLLANLAQQGGAGTLPEPAEVVGSAGGGAVRVHATGELEFTAVHIDPAVLDPGDVSVVEDLVLAAIRDAAGQLRRAGEAALGQMMGDALTGLSGLFGSLQDEDEDEGDDEDEDELDEGGVDETGRAQTGGAAAGDAPGGGAPGDGGPEPHGPSPAAR